MLPMTKLLLRHECFKDQKTTTYFETKSNDLATGRRSKLSIENKLLLYKNMWVPMRY